MKEVLTVLEVLGLLTKVAQAFGLDVGKVLGFACQECPVLRTERMPPLAKTKAARDRAVDRTRGK